MIAEVQKLFRDQGLVVVGINPNDPVADVRQFLNEFQVGGLNMREPLDGPVHKLFRVNAWPAHFLIGKDGRILATDVEVSRLKELIETALRARLG